MLPTVGSSSPATIRSVVVLPQPDGPRRAKKEPAGITSERSSTALKSPYVLVIRVSFKSPRADEMSATSYQLLLGMLLSKKFLLQELGHGIHANGIES